MTVVSRMSGCRGARFEKNCVFHSLDWLLASILGKQFQTTHPCQGHRKTCQGHGITV